MSSFQNWKRFFFFHWILHMMNFKNKCWKRVSCFVSNTEIFWNDSWIHKIIFTINTEHRMTVTTILHNGLTTTGQRRNNKTKIVQPLCDANACHGFLPYLILENVDDMLEIQKCEHLLQFSCSEQNERVPWMLQCLKSKLNKSENLWTTSQCKNIFILMKWMLRLDADEY